jgi:hypothetical protein
VLYACCLLLPFHHSTFNHQNIIWWTAQIVKPLVFSTCIRLPSSFCMFYSNIFLNTLFSNILNLYPSRNKRDQVSHPYKIVGKFLISIFMFFKYQTKVSGRNHCNSSRISFLRLYKCNCDLLLFFILILIYGNALSCLVFISRQTYLAALHDAFTCLLAIGVLMCSPSAEEKVPSSIQFQSFLVTSTFLSSYYNGNVKAVSENHPLISGHSV